MARLRGLALLALLATATCAHRGDSLYRELGGEAGVSRLVQVFLGEVADDTRIVAHFKNTDIKRLERMLNDQICSAAGGPCRYTGDSMVDVHTGMNISHAEFNAMVEDMIAAMTSLQLPMATQNRLLARLAPLRPEIVRR